MGDAVVPYLAQTDAEVSSDFGMAHSVTMWEKQMSMFRIAFSGPVSEVRKLEVVERSDAADPLFKISMAPWKSKLNTRHAVWSPDELPETMSARATMPYRMLEFPMALTKLASGKGKRAASVTLSFEVTFRDMQSAEHTFQVNPLTITVLSRTMARGRIHQWHNLVSASFLQIYLTVRRTLTATETESDSQFEVVYSPQSNVVSLMSMILVRSRSYEQSEEEEDAGRKKVKRDPPAEKPALPPLASVELGQRVNLEELADFALRGSQSPEPAAMNPQSMQMMGSDAELDFSFRGSQTEESQFSLTSFSQENKY